MSGPDCPKEEEKEIPEAIKQYYQIRLLGQYFTEMTPAGIKTGYIYAGVKYYERS